MKSNVYSVKYNKMITVFISVLLIGIIAHGFGYFNQSFAHDSLMVYQTGDGGWQIQLGRFLVPVYVWIRGGIYTPSLVGILQLLYIAGAVYLIIDLLEIKEKKLIFCVSAILTTSCVITHVNTVFTPWSDIYMLAFLLSVFAVWILNRYRYGIICSIIALCLSLGLYQSYIQVSVFLFLIVIVKSIILENKVKDNLILGIKAFISLILSLVLYYIVMKVVLQYSGYELAESYNGLTHVGKYEGNNIIKLLVYTYFYPIRYLLFPEAFHHKIVAFINSVLVLITLYMLIAIIKKRNLDGYNIILMIIMILIMPFGMNVTYFISQGLFALRMIYSYYLVYVFEIMIFMYYFQFIGIEINIRKKVKMLLYNVFIFGIGFLVLDNIIFSNQIYLKKNLDSESTYFNMVRVIDRIEQIEGYKMGETPVAIVGFLSESDLIIERTGIGIQPKYDDGLRDKASVTYYLTYSWYLKNLLSYPINILSATESQRYAEQEEVKSMNAFPAKDSCKILDDGVMVIKFS